MSSSVLHITGGRQKADRDLMTQPEWQHYQYAVIAAVDLETGAIECKATHESPPEVRPDESPSILFKSGAAWRGRFYACTQTEVLVYRIEDWSIERTITIPCFNDLHHVRPNGDDSLLVVSTGLDLVVEIDLEGVVLREWSATGEDPWVRFSREVDYRKVPTTKPHSAHPNYVFSNGGELWATRAIDGDAICLTAPGRAFPRFSDVYVHDGVPRGDLVDFTSVSGHVIRIEASTGRVVRDYDLNSIVGGRTPLGWCRGLHWIDDDRVAVGFSRLRGTRWQRNVRWFKHQLGGKGTQLMATRIAIFDLERGELCAQHDLEPADVNVVFSIHDLG